MTTDSVKLPYLLRVDPIDGLKFRPEHFYGLFYIKDSEPKPSMISDKHPNGLYTLDELCEELFQYFKEAKIPLCIEEISLLFDYRDIGIFLPYCDSRIGLYDQLLEDERNQFLDKVNQLAYQSINEAILSKLLVSGTDESKVN